MARTNPAPIISAANARQLLLTGQGLIDNTAVKDADAAALARLIESLGFVQVDTINVVERAHHLTLWSRMPGFRPQMLAALLESERVLFEHWTHDASIIPLKWYSHWRHRFEQYPRRIRTNKWWRERLGEKPDRLIKSVLNRIIKDGPLQSRDFEHAKEDGGAKSKTRDPKSEIGSWWGWKPQKAALEHLWRCGELAVVRRVNFQKVYDLAERVFPAHHALPAPDWDEHVDWACGSALERLGVATPGEIAAFWHAIAPTEARRWCRRMEKRGDIARVFVEAEDGSEPREAFATGDWKARADRAREAQQMHAVRVLNPFDPILRDRKRTKRLFNFEYTFEGFVPQAKRRYGYFVMPVLEGDRLVARLNPKFHREHGVLEVKGLWWEPGKEPNHVQQRRLRGAIEALAACIGARDVTGC